MTTLAQALRNAIEAEKTAAEFYESLTDRAEDADTRAFLERMAADEREHATEIESFASGIDLDSLPPLADADARSVETAPSWKTAPSISFDDALHIALEAETNAALYYEALADCTSGEVEEFFRKLAHHEEEHVQVLRDTLARNP